MNRGKSYGGKTYTGQSNIPGKSGRALTAKSRSVMQVMTATNERELPSNQRHGGDSIWGKDDDGSAYIFLPRSRVIGGGAQ